MRSKTRIYALLLILSLAAAPMAAAAADTAQAVFYVH